jgi:hypothetical protein
VHESGPFVCIAAGPASALDSLSRGAREHDGRRGIDPVAVYAALMSRVALGWQIWKEHQARRPQVRSRFAGRWSAIASSKNRSVLVFVHFIKLAFAIGIEPSFQVL